MTQAEITLAKIKMELANAPNLSRRELTIWEHIRYYEQQSGKRLKRVREG